MRGPPDAALGGNLAASAAAARVPRAFADPALNLTQVRVAPGVGRSLGEVRTLNSFGPDRADDAVVFAALGARAHW